MSPGRWTLAGLRRGMQPVDVGPRVRLLGDDPTTRCDDRGPLDLLRPEPLVVRARTDVPCVRAQAQPVTGVVSQDVGCHGAQEMGADSAAAAGRADVQIVEVRAPARVGMGEREGKTYRGRIEKRQEPKLVGRRMIQSCPPVRLPFWEDVAIRLRIGQDASARVASVLGVQPRDDLSGAGGDRTHRKQGRHDRLRFAPRARFRTRFGKKNGGSIWNPLILLVGEGGIEPPTPCL